MQVSGTSHTHDSFDIEGRDSQDCFEGSSSGLHVDRPPNYGLSSTWTGNGDASRGKAANDIENISAWTRYGDPSRERAVDNTRFASGRSGWWKEQMLVDRSLRTMAGITSMFALIMLILSIRYFPEFLARKNTDSTSVGSQTGHDCGSLETTNVVSINCCL